MNEYIFYTTEGHTDAPNETIAIDNCQVIGRANGANENEALSNLISENTWIIEAGFDTSKIIAKQLITDELRKNFSVLMNWISSNIKQSCKNKRVDDVIRHLTGALL